MKGRVIHKNQETSDTISIRYELSEHMERKAGHFVMMYLDVDQEGKKKVIKRAYSLSSIPSDPYIETAVKLDGIGSNRIHELNVGDEIKIEGPFGHFVFEEGLADEIILMGAGSGITPLISIIRFIHANKLRTKATLIYSNKTPPDIVYRHELEELGKHENLDINFTITKKDEPESQGWKGLTGRIDKKMVKKIVKNFKKLLFYLCGPPQFVEDLKIMLLEEGVAKENIKQERYGSSED